MGRMREEVVRLYSVQQRAQHKEVSLNETMDLVKECENSKFLPNSGLYDSLLDVKDSLLNFTQRLVNLFQKPASYYNLVELVNAQRTVADTCVCASPGHPDADLLVCILCRAKYHGTCCEWDPFLDRLPECTYLCARCLRGRRPCIEDVQAACNLAPQNSLEVALVRELICRARELSSNAMSVLSSIGDDEKLSTELEEKAQTVVESVLACEVLDMDILPK
ncbi:hypothetical protein TELCIR_21648, partial [Teladorsagia circumcincta]